MDQSTETINTKTDFKTNAITGSKKSPRLKMIFILSGLLLVAVFIMAWFFYGYSQKLDIIEEESKKIISLTGVDMSFLGDSLLTSLDGQQVAYINKRENNQSIVLNGEEGPAYDEINNLFFSRDGQYFNYTASKGDKYFIVLSGQEIPLEIYVNSIFYIEQVVFSDDGKQYAAIIEDNEGFDTVILNGQILNEPKEYYGAEDATFSPDGTKFVYSHRNLLILNNEIVKYDDAFDIGYLTFSEDSQQFAYVLSLGEDYTQPLNDDVVFNNERQKEYSYARNLKFNQNGNMLVYEAGTDNDNHYFVINGEEQKKHKITAWGYALSPDGKRIAYPVQEGNDYFMVVDNQKIKPFGYGPMFSPDSQHLAYISRDKGWLDSFMSSRRTYPDYVSVDGKKSSSYENIWNLHFSSDSNKIYFNAVIDDEIWLIAAKVPKTSDHSKNDKEIFEKALLNREDIKKYWQINMLIYNIDIAINKFYVDYQGAYPLSDQELPNVNRYMKIDRAFWDENEFVWQDNQLHDYFYCLYVPLQSYQNQNDKYFMAYPEGIKYTSEPCAFFNTEPEAIDDTIQKEMAYVIKAAQTQDNSYCQKPYVSDRFRSVCLRATIAGKCNVFNEIDDKARCITDLAISENSASLCYASPEGTSYVNYYTEKCLANFQSDSLDCSTLIDQQEQDTCWSAADNCIEVKDDIYRRICFAEYIYNDHKMPEFYAEYGFDKSVKVCRDMSTQFYKEECFKFLAAEVAKTDTDKALTLVSEVTEIDYPGYTAENALYSNQDVMRQIIAIETAPRDIDRAKEICEQIKYVTQVGRRIDASKEDCINKVNAVVGSN